jgi:hypothetical protein
MNNRGSLTLEALISIFFTSSLILMCILIVNTFFINEVVNQGIYETAIEMSSNNIATQYGNNILNAQEKSIELLSSKMLTDNFKYNILRYVDASEITTDYSLSDNEGYLEIDYSKLIMKLPININKRIKYKSFLHKTIPVKDIGEIKVYVTNTGNKYHKNGCFYLRKSKIETNLYDAIKNGYTPCSKCYENKTVKN